MKESTHKLMTLDFWRICISNFLLYSAVWTLLPILPAQCYLMGMNTQEMVTSFLLFVSGMIGVGPLHAFLGDVFKRKNVLMLSTLATALCFGGWLMVTESWQVMLLMLLAGVFFGIATTAGITIGIDITLSNRRGMGNRMYAFSGAVGLLIGLRCLSPFYLMIDFSSLVIFSLVLFFLSLVFEAGVYVAFRAPVGVGLFNIDRFFLPLAWVPAVNVCLLSFGIGMLLNLLDISRREVVVVGKGQMLHVVLFAQMLQQRLGMRNARYGEHLSALGNAVFFFCGGPLQGGIAQGGEENLLLVGRIEPMLNAAGFFGLQVGRTLCHHNGCSPSASAPAFAQTALGHHVVGIVGAAVVGEHERNGWFYVSVLKGIVEHHDVDCALLHKKPNAPSAIFAYGHREPLAKLSLDLQRFVAAKFRLVVFSNKAKSLCVPAISAA